MDEQIERVLEDLSSSCELRRFTVLAILLEPGSRRLREAFLLNKARAAKFEQAIRELPYSARSKDELVVLGKLMLSQLAKFVGNQDGGAAEKSFPEAVQRRILAEVFRECITRLQSGREHDRNQILLHWILLEKAWESMEQANRDALWPVAVSLLSSADLERASRIMNFLASFTKSQDGARDVLGVFSRLNEGVALRSIQPDQQKLLAVLIKQIGCVQQEFGDMASGFEAFVLIRTIRAPLKKAERDIVS